ncbi:MAG: right-handed parallel beta-helix repeat-containing protein [Planctomycetota bacterium]|nr:right-handed parallel beta-helix repeat-containing protein [Planctomycetota bacterium]
MSHRQTLLAAVFAVFLCRVALSADLAELAQARPGAVVELPAGTFAGGFTVPPGVTLRGAGCQRTVIEARGAAVAVKLTGKGARVENLSVTSSGVGIDMSAAEDVAVRRVLIVGGTTGIRAGQVDQATIENVIVARALIGISLNQARRSTVANCTVFTADACGLSVSQATDTAVFNNVVVHAGTGVVVGGENRNLALDYNLYVALTIGKLEGQLQRPSLPTWRDVTGGLDAHSVQLNVDFANPHKNDFHPVTTLSWNPSRIVTADWGVPELAGHKAPLTDLDGQPRAGAYDLGVFEAPDMPARPADGQFQIAADEGLKSAGVFTPDNRAVSYLFQGLPLKKGVYGFTLPTRDLFGRPIPPGNYELRVVESQVDWIYRGMAANAGAGPTADESDSIHVGLVAYTPDNQLLTASGWSERHINLRLGDPATGKARWVFEGSADSTGLCLDGAGRIYLARNGADKSVDLYRIDPATGTPIARSDGRLCVNLKGKFRSQYLGGLAELGGKLYAADAEVDQVLFATVDSLRYLLGPAADDATQPARVLPSPR